MVTDPELLLLMNQPQPLIPLSTNKMEELITKKLIKNLKQQSS